MNTKTVAMSTLLFFATTQVNAQPSSPTGGATWMVFGGGFLLGLGAGLLWCWLRCRKLKSEQRTDLK